MVAEGDALGYGDGKGSEQIKGMGCLKGREGRGSRHLLEGICQEGEGTLSGKGGSATFLGHGRGTRCPSESTITGVF